MNDTTKPSVALFGVGEMGKPMLRRLLAAGRDVRAVDLDPQRVVDAGGTPASPEGAAVCDVVLLSIRGTPATVGVAESVLLPAAREGQIIVDTGTVRPKETRRLAERFAERGATWLDCPVSGGPGGVEQGQLRVFAGGDREAVERVRPILADVAGPDLITYCGPSGSGQITKGVNQLMMGLVNAAHLEAIAYGVKLGVDPKVLREAVGGDGRWREDFGRIADKVVAGHGRWETIKYHELPDFIAEAREADMELPLATATMATCRDDLPKVIHDFGKPAPSFWDALLESHPS